MRAHTHKWLAAIILAIACSIGVNVTLQSQPRQYEYVAVLADRAIDEGITDAAGIRWTCTGNRCSARGTAREPNSIFCARLAEKVGRVRSYSHGGSYLDTAELIECNRDAADPRDPRTSAGIKPTRPTPDATKRPPRRDFDGDGDPSITDGGGDCDDNDPRRSSVHPELSDLAGFDEDCDSKTFGAVDADKDGHYDARYFNRVKGVITSQGTDCDDSLAHIHPGQAESCNTFDDNCNGVIDEGVKMRAWHDRDGDLFGDPRAEVMICPTQLGPEVVTNNNDCDDTNPKRNPLLGCR